MIEIITMLVTVCILTCILEMIPFFFFRNSKKWIKASLICNLITNPIVNLILTLINTVISDDTRMIIIAIVLELLVVAYETFLYMQLTHEKLGKCLIVSLLVNILSFGLGLMAMLVLYAVEQAPIGPSALDPAYFDR